jgi:hypothetical protein
MIKSKVIDALKALNKSELKELGDFIDSPYFNKNKSVQSLYRILKNNYPSFDSKNLSKHNVYSRLFPGKPYADKTLRNLLSDLLNLIERYLAFNSINRSPLNEKYFVISGMLKKRLFSLTESNLKEADRMFNNSKFDGGNVYYIMHLIEMEKDFLSISKNKLINLNMKEGEYLIYAFLSKYLIFKMKYYNYRYKLGTEQLSSFIVEFEKSINIENFAKYLETSSEPILKIILIYYYCTKFVSDPSAESYYWKVKSLVNTNKNLINRNEIINIYLTFNAFCVAKIREGNTSYEKELFYLFKEMVKDKLYLGEGEKYMHLTIFNNIVSLGLKIGELEWTKSFIDKYSEDLLPEFKDTMFNYSYSQYYFRQKEYEKALEHIKKVNFENYYIKNGVRFLLLKIYFELGYTESFISLCDSIKHYLAKDKLLPEDKKTSDYKFVNLVNKLYQYVLEPEEDKLDYINSEVLKGLPGTHSDWLQEKLRELEH